MSATARNFVYVLKQKPGDKPMDNVLSRETLEQWKKDIAPYLSEETAKYLRVGRKNFATRRVAKF